MFIILTGIVPDLKSAIRIDDHVPLMFLLSSYYTVLLMSVSAMDEQGWSKLVITMNKILHLQKRYRVGMV